MADTNAIELFQTRIQSVPEIAVLVNGVSEDAEVRESTNGTKIGDPMSIGLSLVIVAALWKLLNIGIGALRTMSEDTTAERRIQLIRQLQEMGYDRQAPFIVDRLLKEMRERPEDDPVLTKLTELYPG